MGLAIFFCAIGALLANVVILWHIHSHDQEEEEERERNVQVRVSAEALAVLVEAVKAEMAKGEKP